MMATPSQIKTKQGAPAGNSRKVLMVSMACVALVGAGVLFVLQLTKWQAEPGTPIAETGPPAKPTAAAAQPSARAAGTIVPPAESNAPSAQNRAGGRMVPPDAVK